MASLPVLQFYYKGKTTKCNERPCLQRIWKPCNYHTSFSITKFIVSSLLNTVSFKVRFLLIKGKLDEALTCSSSNNFRLVLGFLPKKVLATSSMSCSKDLEQYELCNQPKQKSMDPWFLISRTSNWIGTRQICNYVQTSLICLRLGAYRRYRSIHCHFSKVSQLNPLFTCKWLWKHARSKNRHCFCVCLKTT